MVNWILLLLFALAASQVEAQNVTAWTNGFWFNGSSFVRADVYSVEGKLIWSDHQQSTGLWISPEAT
jgi:hypothetical protein